MEIKRTTNILVKTQRKSIVRQIPDERIDCENCAETMISTQNAALLFDTGTREIYRLVESGKIRFVETESKIIYVCPNCMN